MVTVSSKMQAFYTVTCSTLWLLLKRHKYLKSSPTHSSGSRIFYLSYKSPIVGVA